MNKLKINKTFIKGPRKKSKVKRIRKKIEILKQKRTNEYFFGEEREKQMVTGDELFICLLHGPPYTLEEDVTSIITPAMDNSIPTLNVATHVT
jgi:hypothetical protein